MDEELDMEFSLRDQVRLRLRLVMVMILLASLTILLRHLTVVLSYSYSLRGGYGAIVAALLLGLSINFLYALYRFLKKVGPGSIAVYKGILGEWRSSTPLNKILILSGLLSLPGSLVAIADWCATATTHLLQIFNN